MTKFHDQMQPILAAERPRMTAAVDDYLKMTAGMPIRERIHDAGRKPFLTERFQHLDGITRAYIVAQCSMSAARLVRDQHLASLPDEDKISCDNGWHAIVERFLAACRQQPGWLFKSAGEEWGGISLRYACDPAGEEACRAAEKEAVASSLLTCEKCGAPGRLRGGNRWKKTRCDQHASGYDD